MFKRIIGILIIVLVSGVLLVNSNFSSLSYVIAGENVLAAPLAYYVMNQWLQNFAYRIDFGLDIFILAGLLALAITLATVSWQTIRAATANPVESLRYE